MIDDEEKQLKLELLRADVDLRRKQEFWETPRNIAILVGVVAAIAAAIGYWLGYASGRPTVLLRRITGATSDEILRTDQFIDAVQTAGIVVIAGMLVYVVVRLSWALTVASEKLREALTGQKGLQETIERVWRRVDVLEQNPNTAELKALLGEIRGRLDRLEGRKDDH